MMPIATHPVCAALAIVVWLSAAASAQVSPTPGPIQQVPTQPTIKLTMDDRHAMREWLLKPDMVKPQAVRFDLQTGERVPADVQLHPFPDELSGRIRQLKPHRFFIAGDVIVVVEPQARTIVDVVK